MSNTNRVNRVFIGSGTNNGSGALPDVKVGDLFIYDSKNNLIDTVTKAQNLSARETITIATAGGKDGNVLQFPFTGALASAYEGQSYVAPAQLQILIGDPAVDGIPVVDGKEYRLRVFIKDDQRVQGQRPTLWDANYPARTNVTQEEVAGFIFCQWHQKDYGHNYMSDKVLVERVSNGTFTALTNNATVIKGSKVVTSTGHGVTIGDKVFLRLGIAGPGANEPVYVATAVDANTFELDYPYVGESGTILAANALTATDTTQWGFKLTGVEQESFLERASNEPVDQYEWMNFDGVFSEAEDRAIESAADKKILTELNPGQGFWKQVADREEAAKGYWGDTSKRRFHDKRINSVTDVNANYNSIVISHDNEHRGNFQDTYKAPLKTEIYIPTGSAQGDDTPANNEFLAILNAYFVDVLKFNAISF